MQDNGHVELDAFLNTPLRGLENSQIYENELTHPAAYEASSGRNRCAYQLSIALSLDFEKLWDEPREMFEEHDYPQTSDYVTMEMVAAYAKKHGHSCYLLKTGSCCTNTSAMDTRRR